ACTLMERHQHYPVAESHAIYSLPIKIEYQFSCESDKSWLSIWAP
ncbi:hypothetical protein ACN42_g4528, partial [Penicillium freii]